MKSSRRDPTPDRATQARGRRLLMANKILQGWDSSMVLERVNGALQVAWSPTPKTRRSGVLLLGKDLAALGWADQWPLDSAALRLTWELARWADGRSVSGLHQIMNMGRRYRIETDDLQTIAQMGWPKMTWCERCGVKIMPGTMPHWVRGKGLNGEPCDGPACDSCATVQIKRGSTR